jgi:hypothetical protein
MTVVTLGDVHRSLDDGSGSCHWGWEKPGLTVALARAVHLAPNSSNETLRQNVGCLRVISGSNSRIQTLMHLYAPTRKSPSGKTRPADGKAITLWKG